MAVIGGDELADGQACLLKNLELCVVDERWQYAIDRADLIAAHWRQRLSENPKMFNGCIHVMLRHGMQDGRLSAHYAATDFASYLYWRENGFDDGTSSCDGFACVLLCGSGGGYLVARAAPHTLNAGYDVPPGGMIDERDVDDSGRIDAISYGLRELYEETGLAADEVIHDGEVWAVRDGALLAMGLVCRSRLPDDVIIERVNAHNAGATDAELSGAKWFDPVSPSPEIRVPRYVALLTEARTRSLRA